MEWAHGLIPYLQDTFFNADYLTYLCRCFFPLCRKSTRGLISFGCFYTPYGKPALYLMDSPHIRYAYFWVVPSVSADFVYVKSADTLVTVVKVIYLFCFHLCPS